MTSHIVVRLDFHVPVQRALVSGVDNITKFVNSNAHNLWIYSVKTTKPVFQISQSLQPKMKIELISSHNLDRKCNISSLTKPQKNAMLK